MFRWRGECSMCKLTPPTPPPPHTYLLKTDPYRQFWVVDLLGPDRAFCGTGRPHFGCRHLFSVSAPIPPPINLAPDRGVGTNVRVWRTCVIPAFASPFRKLCQHLQNILEVTVAALERVSARSGPLCSVGRCPPLWASGRAPFWPPKWARADWWRF